MAASASARSVAGRGERRARFRELVRQFVGAGQGAADLGGCHDAVAQAGEVARAAPAEAEPSQGPRHVGRAQEDAPQALALDAPLDQPRHRLVTASDGGDVGERAAQALREEPRPAGRQRQVDGGEKAAAALARQRARDLEIGAGRGVDGERRARCFPARRRQRRPAPELGALDVKEGAAGGGDLGAAEGAEGVEGGDAENLLDAPLGGGRVEPFPGERRHGRARLAPQIREGRIVVDGLRQDDLARIEAGDLGGEAVRVRLTDEEASGRDVDGGEPKDGSAVREAPPRHGDEEVGARRIEQVVLGDGAGGDEPHHVPAHDRLVAALPRFRGILGLLAHGDAMAEADEALQIIVGALDRDAAHGDVGARVLAALGQDDAERPAGGLRVGEEQFVEIAHPVEQEAVGIRRLDLQILRHHRRDARVVGGERPGSGRVAIGGRGRGLRRPRRRGGSCPHAATAKAFSSEGVPGSRENNAADRKRERIRDRGNALAARAAAYSRRDGLFTPPLTSRRRSRRRRPRDRSGRRRS